MPGYQILHNGQLSEGDKDVLRQFSLDEFKSDDGKVSCHNVRCIWPTCILYFSWNEGKWWTFMSGSRYHFIIHLSKLLFMTNYILYWIQCTCTSFKILWKLPISYVFVLCPIIHSVLVSSGHDPLKDERCVSQGISGLLWFCHLFLALFNV